MRFVLGHIDWHRTIGLGFQALTDDPDWMAALLEELRATVVPSYVLHMHNTGRVTELQAWQITGSGIDFVRSFANPQPRGVDVGQISPHQCAALVRWTTGLSGRANRGRTFLWLFSVYHVFQGQELLDGLLERMQAWIDAMLANYGPGGTSAIAQFVIISRQLDRVRRPTPVGIPVTAGQAVNLIATQRSRVGPHGGGG